MKPSRFALHAIVIAMAATSTLGVTLPVFAADDGRTPGPAEPADGNSRQGSPYVPPADVQVPESSKSIPADAGKRSHTNILIRKPSGDQPEPAAPLPPKKVRKKRH